MSKTLTERLRVLAISADLPRSDRSSGDRRYVAILEILAKRARVDLYASTRGPRSTSLPEKAIWKTLGVRVLPPLYWKVEHAVTRTLYDLVWIEKWHMAEKAIPVFRRYQPRARVVVDTVDVHFLREEAGAALGLFSLSKVADNREREIRVYQSADAVIAVTEDDRRALAALPNMPPIFIVPNIVSVGSRSEERKPPPPEVLFIGGFKHPPNEDGIVWFVHAVWPLVKSMAPAAQLKIVGSNPTPNVLKLAHLPDIAVVGPVPDTRPYLNRAAVSIAPLRYGGGMKGKVTEAMGCGVPVVTTTVGAQGLDAVSAKDLFIADEPHEFAERVVALIRDPRLAEVIGLSGQKLVSRLCSPEAAARTLDDLVEVLHVPLHLSAGDRIRWFTLSVGAWLRRLWARVRRVLG